MKFQIRKENPKDYREVEEVTREAFWNLFVPGCDEHYLVNVMRSHQDFLDEYALVAVDSESGKIIGNIMYTKSRAVNETGKELNTLSFGPISVLPERQNKGIGSKLIEATVEMAKSHQVPAIIIEGHPRNYCKHGFKSCFDFNISNVEGRFPYGLLVLELQKNVFKGGKWVYHRSPVYDVDGALAVRFDRRFPAKEKIYKPSQEEFSIACRAYIHKQTL